MILFPKLSHKNSLQAVTIDGEAYIRIDHEFERDDGSFTIFGGTCQNDTEIPSNCPTIDLAGDSEQLVRLITEAKVQLFECGDQKEGEAFNNDADFCLHYRDYMSGARQGWRFHVLKVYPSQLKLYYANDADDFEIVNITPPEIPFTISVPSSFDDSDPQMFRVQKQHQGFINIYAKVGKRWVLAVSIQQNVTPVNSDCVVSRYYPMSALPDAPALKTFLNHVTEDGVLYW